MNASLVQNAADLLQEIHEEPWSLESTVALLERADGEVDEYASEVDGGGQPSPESRVIVTPMAGDHSWLECEGPNVNDCGDPHPGCGCC